MTSHTITGIFPAGYNVTVGTLFNQGTISGPLPSNGIGLYSANSADIINSGKIAPGSLHPAVSLHAGGTLTNQSGGTIGGSFGVSISGGAGTVVNAGGITGTTGYGIDLRSGGSITNAASASITGYSTAIDVSGGVGTVVNEGSIAVSATHTDTTGVLLGAGGSVTNAASALIAGGHHAVYISGGAGTVVNDGAITALSPYGIGVYVRAGGSVTNATSGVITANFVGIEAVGAGGTVANVTNYGSISGNFNGVGALRTSLTNAASGSIAGGSYGAVVSDTALVNEGRIASTGGDGVLMDFGSNSVTNAASAAISGARWGVNAQGGGLVTNAASAVITGIAGGVFAVDGAGILRNAGTVSGTGTSGIGVYLDSGGSVTNAASGLITGVNAGVRTGSWPAFFMHHSFAGIVVNEGTITSTDGIAVDLRAGGTLTNAGKIVGNGTAVAFGSSYAGLLVLEPGFALTGLVAGSATANDRLELASATSAGVLTGFGTQFVNFRKIWLDAGATWAVGGAVTAGQAIHFAGASDLLTFSNPGSISGTIEGFNDSDTIALAGIANVTSTTIDANNLLTVTRSVGAPITLQFSPSQDFSAEIFHHVVSGSMTDITIAARTEHWVAGNGNFNTPAQWKPQYIPSATNDVIINAPGTYTVTVTTDETVKTLAVAANATLVVSAGTFAVSNGSVAGGLAGAIIVDAGAVLALQGAAVNTGTIAGAGQLGDDPFALTNSGTIEATGAGGLTIAGGTVSNTGTMRAANSSTLTFQSGVVNTNNTGGVLKGGTWEADGGGVLAMTGGAAAVDKATIILSGAGSAFTAGDGSTFTDLQASLLNVAPIGTLELGAGAALTMTHQIADFGMIQLAGGTLTLPRLAVGAIGHVRGFGTITDTRFSLWNGGTIEANGGTLAVASAIDPASTGVFQLDASSLLEIAADRGAGDKMNFVGTGGELVIDAALKFGLNVGTSGYTGPLIENFASGDMVLLKNVAPAGLTPAYDASTGILQISKGAINVASLAFENATLGTGSFQLGGDGHGHALLTHS